MPGTFAFRACRLLLAAALCVSAAVMAGEETLHPRIALAGGVIDHGRHPNVDDRRIRRLLFDLDGGATTPEGGSRDLDLVARAVNLYALAEVPPERIRIAVILRGQATALVLSPAAYRARFGHDKPDAALLDALLAAGVRIEVCGQALAHQGYRDGELDARIPVVLAGLLRREELLAEGYVLAR